MAALFSKPPKPDTSAQEAQLLEQRRQNERIREQEVEEGMEKGSRSRILNARLRSRGVPQLVNTGGGGGGSAGATLAG